MNELLQSDKMSDLFIVSNDSRRELAHRSGGGIEVTLYWNAADNSTSVDVFYPATEETLRFGVPRERALDAFYHPFAHIPAWPEDGEHSFVT
jgi:YD repeat-containing protein